MKFSNKTLKMCLDIDECQEDSSCGINYFCTNSWTSYSCDCEPGFQRYAFQTVEKQLEVIEKCVDIDECTQDGSLCSPIATCKNLGGSYQCECNNGFKGDGHFCAGYL